MPRIDRDHLPASVFGEGFVSLDPSWEGHGGSSVRRTVGIRIRRGREAFEIRDEVGSCSLRLTKRAFSGLGSALTTWLPYGRRMVTGLGFLYQAI